MIGVGEMRSRHYQGYCQRHSYALYLAHEKFVR
jgi:hypothetical protein